MSLDKLWQIFRIGYMQCISRVSIFSHEHPYV